MNETKTRLSTLAAACAVAVLVVVQPPSLAAQTPHAVSPGSAMSAAPLAGSCPTFSWSGSDNATGYELVLYRVTENGTLETEFQTRVEGARASSWTPSAARCLGAEGDYAWAVRALTEAGPGRWSELLLFSSSAAPSEEEVRQAMATLRRYLAGDGRGDHEPSSEASVTSPASSDESNSVPSSEVRPDPRAFALSQLFLGEEGHGSTPTAIHAVESTASGASIGVAGHSTSTSGTGVFGFVPSLDGETVGVLGQSVSLDGIGVAGVNFRSGGSTLGVYGQSNSPDGRGVYGLAGHSSGNNIGIWGESTSSVGRGVYGLASATSGTNYGVYGLSSSPSGWAGYFNGRVHVAGELSKASGSFRIDHPLDPANKYLAHSFVESPEMLNVYNGNATLDANGAAWVELPEWFDALNRDFRYQLTALDRPSPWLHVGERIAGNRFRIAGGESGTEVSWQVTGVRRDAYAERNRIVVEEDKGELRGRYLHPEAFDLPPQLAIGYFEPGEAAARQADTASGEIASRPRAGAAARTTHSE